PTSITATSPLSLHDALPIYADLQALASVDELVTLECVSNEVGGNLISTAEWTGVRLATILQSAGVDLSPGNWIVFTCADGYTAGDRKSTRLNSSHQIISYAV